MWPVKFIEPSFLTSKRVLSSRLNTSITLNESALLPSLFNEDLKILVWAVDTSLAESVNISNP